MSEETMQLRHRVEARAVVDPYVDPRWYACYTRSRHEKRVEESLLRQGLTSYLPTVERVSVWKDRKKRVRWPLFPGYVFARFTLSDVHTVLVTAGVSTIVKVSGIPKAIPDSDIENVRRFVDALDESGLEPETQPYVEEGESVLIHSGPFKGIRGLVLERRGKKRVLVGLSAIGRGVEVDLETSSLQLLRPRA